MPWWNQIWKFSTSQVPRSGLIESRVIIKPTLNTHTQIKNWFGKRWLMFFGRSKKFMIANQSKWLPIFKIGILQRKARCAYKHPKMLLVGSIGDGVCVSCFLHLPNPPTGIVPGHHLGIPTPWLSTDMSSPFIKGVCSVFAQKQTYLGRPPP